MAATKKVKTFVRVDSDVLRSQLTRLEELAGKLRATAEGLRTWQRNGGTHGPGAGHAGINPYHAAKRLEKLADEVDGGSSEGGNKQ